MWSARSAGAREPAILWEIVIPAALPEILNGIRVALALCFILVIAGELIFANDGIGYLISFLGESGDYSGMFAGVLAISLIGFVADRLFVLATRRSMVLEGTDHDSDSTASDDAPAALGPDFACRCRP